VAYLDSGTWRGQCYGVAKKRRPEPTQPRNPRQLTIEQHVHSRANIARFVDETGRVAVLRRPSVTPIQVAPGNTLLCTRRVWSHKVESGFFRSVEHDFQREVERALLLGTVLEHGPVTAYFSIWQIRSRFASNPPADVVLNGIGNSSLTKDQEELLEKRGIMFTRGPLVPGRFQAELDVMTQHDRDLHALHGSRWGFLRGPTTSGLLCPDRPTTRWIPLTRHVVLVAGYPDQPMPDETVEDLNKSTFDEASSFVFGHPKDVRCFLRRNPNPWG
jgi:hypothetical protein